MSYCVNCGVGLDPSAKTCPLCGTPAWHPELDAPPYFPANSAAVQPASRREAAILLTAMLVSVSLCCGLLNLFLPTDRPWSLYVIGAAVMLWVWFALPMVLRRLPVFFRLTADVAAIGIYVWLISIDLVDEAGAYREIHPTDTETQTVDKALITDILARICKVDVLAMKEEDNATLETLHERISAKIYGQEEAVCQVVEAVQMAKAGLQDENKPLASLLFVGPTGVGKTEVAKVLASELGIALQRFDMSEYTEKHTVAKLIGSPAGYIGYEDGGLLTDAIRKTPNCVLLLDEIEKAHPDIFNILLQVMDYAVLTDNKGRKADCRHVILIMTSNAGAQFAHQASIGFSGQITAGEAMLKQVKKTFKPEFINRLSATVVFHDMDYGMASLILNKKLNELKNKLSARHVGMELSPEAYKHLLKLGFTKEYGAREMDRVITSQLKPLLMREILFGALKTGGKVRVTAGNGELSLQVLKE